MHLQASNIINGENAAKTQGSEGFQAKLFISEITVPFQNLVSCFFFLPNFKKDESPLVVYNILSFNLRKEAKEALKGN